MKKLLVALLIAGGISFACAPAGADVAPCTESFTHLGSGGKLTSTGSAVTSYMAPSTDSLVFVFVSVATTNGSTAPAPVLTGMGVTWTQNGPFYKSPGAPRSFTSFYAMDAVAGTLTISGLPTPKTHVTWSIAQGGDTIVQTATNVAGILETSHSVTLDAAPEGAVIAGYLVGQQGTVDDGPPYVDLGQGHTSFFTTFTQWDVDGPGDYQTATAYWAQPGHAIATAFEVVCA